MKAIDRILFVVLVIAGAYMLLFHTDPFPANHEAIGLGQVHILHDIVGVVLIGIAIVVWRRSRAVEPKIQA